MKGRAIYDPAFHSPTKKIILSYSSHISIDLTIWCYKLLRQEQFPAAGLSLFSGSKTDPERIKLKYLDPRKVIIASSEIEPAIC